MLKCRHGKGTEQTANLVSVSESVSTNDVWQFDKVRVVISSHHQGLLPSDEV